MKILVNAYLLFALMIAIAAHPGSAKGAGGITPEQIFQPEVTEDSLMGTWEVLPEETPLAEQERPVVKARPRILLALRKDFTCRIFNQEHPTGSDGRWNLKNHELSITLPSRATVEFYVYGVKGDFMITRSPIKEGKDQLWSRVK